MEEIPDSVLDGRTDDNPFILPSSNINLENFDHLLTYMFCGPSEHPINQDVFLIDVLNLSTFLEIEDRIDYVIHQFEARTFFCPILQFYLACTYRIDHWIAPAFRELMQLPVLTFSLDDSFRIGPLAYHKLIQTKARIDVLVHGLAYNAPQVTNAPGCQTPHECDTAWQNEWVDQVAFELLHPDTHYNGRSILRKVEQMLIPDMCSGCHRHTITSLQSTGVFDRDAKFIDDAVIELMSHQTDERIRTSLRDLAVSESDSN
ncbi:hypothetical protein NLJ89_g4717 [Agrocybe chaxingu]|uniref:Uncharacterized protein n=1 Tax=Agrocybe chaxingu TaxID=84603 RepID=A0A9W8K290_9AGAR|nr:hypothetical protein NLJ89_g4717 [Agrocybe chaxingu]